VDTKPALQNIQDAFLNVARRERSVVTIFLLYGAKLTGRIKSFDKFSLILESGTQELLIFKHAISTIQHARRMSGELRQTGELRASGELRQTLQASAPSLESPAEITEPVDS
jgi:host factor-I protein